ncbi:glycosyltransferase family 76 protein [Ophiostoma piceae UAMH 11346]|uniref:GPI mannosyltransferase 2 n=1 Tax=Ophiostoma piceae (strain UAMH 11346) TaxID=1262450 RepID=S3C3M7_OPHP1|nr:glycosyltransferase family 76 protein [Ophiostoma piceae UAMH 11346]
MPTTPTTTDAHSAPVHAQLLDHRKHPYRSLAVVFGVWKSLLLLIAVVARLAGPAYDTSGDLLEAAALVTSNGGNKSYFTTNNHAIPVGGIVSRLTSWDAIYFVQSAHRGYVYEQEWAFGAGLPLAVSAIRDGLNLIGLDAPVPVVAVAYVHVAHLLSVLVLYRLGQQLWLGSAGRTASFVAACLHVLSPAGLFLSAPYAESSCALFTFVGYAAYVAGRKQDTASAMSFSGDLLRLAAGISFGVATVFRTNGLLNGVVFAYEAVTEALHFLRQPSTSLFRRLVFIGLGGLCVAAGSAIPQTVAYLQFCSEPSGVPGEDYRSWCKATVPSIYNFVQERYWGSGRLFNYWTLSNLPLFILATPMLLVMARSSLDIWSSVSSNPKSVWAEKRGSEGNASKAGRDGPQSPVFDPRLSPIIRCMAATQLLLAVMAFTSYHVQIVSRLSSGYPVWYWWLAQNLAGGPKSGLAEGFVVFMVMYAAIQGILFASFLPPA